ncbi:MOB kinase activator-like 2 isoform X2 [Anastrepha obliqua]|uniref:MOB kinase activator-like 2 isoform X2 n=1 Tax=Anastrepha obliqua TaxID=95512 RepID=UPI0024097B93|nr:MOB kinase activator-like 2 isoform X2 [Anastrepha obliqua]
MSFASANSKTSDETATSLHRAITASTSTIPTDFAENSAAHTTLSTPSLSSPPSVVPSATSAQTTPIGTSTFAPTHSYAASVPTTSCGATSTVTFNPAVTTFTAHWTHNSSSDSSGSSAKSSFSSSTYSSALSETSAAVAAATKAAAPRPSSSSSTARKGVTQHKSPANAASSFVVKCLWKTVRFMWQVTEIPMKIGETIGSIYRYAHDSVETILCVAGKARRKERDGDQNSTDTKLYLEESVLERKLPEADLKALVDLPAGLDYNEWLASHTLALFEHVNLVYGTISEFCTPSGCPDMTGPGNRTYLWFDEKGKKTRVAAPQYIDYVMTFTQKTVSDESIFPTKYANEFPSSFESIARKILRLQFHVIAHLYAAHFREIALLGLHTHLNLTFAHLTALHRRFTLIDEKETDVLRDLEVALRLTDDGQSSLASSTITATTDGGSSSGGGGGGGGSSSTTDSGIANSSSSSSGVGSGATTATTYAHSQQQHSGVEDVNLLQQQQQQSATLTTGTTVIDGDAGAPPICTQPEAHVKQTNNTHASAAAVVFGGGGGLIGGILGDLSSGEFGETATRYCTSALPQQNAEVGGAGAGPGAAVLAMNCNNGGAGALHLNFNNNHHHHHHHHHQHPHAHHHAAQQQVAHHFTQQQQQHQQHSGLIQCNASNAPHANTVNASVAAAAASATNASTATTTTTA